MIGYIQRLETLGFIMDAELSVDLILQSLPESFSQFILNFNMNAMERTLSELKSMLFTAQEDMKTSKSVMLVDATSSKKGKGKNKAKAKSKPKAQNVLKASGGVSKDGKVVCFYCGKSGHWRRHCKAFLASKKKNYAPSSSGMFMIEVNLSPVTSWVMDTGCGSHICTSV